MKNTKTKILANKKHITVLIIVLAIIIIIAGYLYYKNEENFYKRQKYNELKAIADLKENQIINWINKRDSEAKVLTNSPFFVRAVINLVRYNNNENLRKEIIERLLPFEKELGYNNIFILKSKRKYNYKSKTIQIKIGSIRYRKS